MAKVVVFSLLSLLFVLRGIFLNDPLPVLFLVSPLAQNFLQHRGQRPEISFTLKLRRLMPGKPEAEKHMPNPKINNNEDNSNSNSNDICLIAFFSSTTTS